MSVSIVWVQASGKIADVELDSVVSQVHTLEAKPTKNPVEEGVVVTDHVTIEPTQLVLTGLITNTPLVPGSATEYPRGQPGRAQEVFEALVRLRDARQLVTVIAPPTTDYDNMLVQSISIPEDAGPEMLKVTVTLVELVVVTTQQTELPASALARGKGKVNDGKKSGKAEPYQSKIVDITEGAIELTEGGDGMVGKLNGYGKALMTHATKAGAQ